MIDTTTSSKVLSSAQPALNSIVEAGPSLPDLTKLQMRETSAESGLRTDIQALRGLAILLVLMHHSRLFPAMTAGYLGVDIFFVVSGFLITGIVARDIRAGRFCFGKFYLRRARRLLPAAYVTFLFTILGASLFMSQLEMRDFWWQLVGAVTFTGNIALWMQTGYFEGTAALKPLLHVWSLSIEEQYYLLLPAALVATPSRYWKLLVLVSALLSLALCVLLLEVKPGATFYLLPTRAWEMGIGSVAALAGSSIRISKFLPRIYFLALCIVLILPVFPIGTQHPGIDAFLVCVATAIIILRRSVEFNGNIIVRLLARLGDMSYSVYLVHWPMFALAANAWVREVPLSWRLSITLLSLGLGAAMYRFVEQPTRRLEIGVNWRSAVIAATASLAIIFCGYAVAYSGDTSAQRDFANERRPNVGLNGACEYAGSFHLKPECATAGDARLLLWGDSHAMQLLPGIEATTEHGVVQATMSRTVWISMIQFCGISRNPL